ncbi:MAG TPA: alpha/beta fold hydrolase [Methanomassiliicoccales archaeon]|jgi:pimeloyl-ACP methyl ester carboxylesterase|nr:alpha/beta fold hydrolase [Methanomassiliicoccales archaeon]
MPKVEIGDARINYETHGEGEPLVLITGLGGEIAFWKKYLPHLSRSHQVVVLDNRGAGETDYPPTLFTMSTMANDVAGLMEHLGHDRYHVLGWSLGGNVAQRVAIDHSDKVGALVLMSTYTRRPERSSFAIDTMIRTVDEGATFDSLMELMQSWCLPEDYFKKLALAKPAQRRCNGNGKRAAEGFKAQKLALDLFDSHGLLEKVSAPTLIIHGDEDIMVSPHFARELADHIAGSQVEWVSGAGHIIPADKCCSSILRWLKAHPL